jgi:hypothetical protein
VAKSKASANANPQGRRLPRPRIDLDDSIAKAQESFKLAAKAMAKARAEARNEKRKKARLYKKCAQLSALDLERIAVLKRSGLWDPNVEGVGASLVLSAAARSQDAASTASSSGLNRDQHLDDGASATRDAAEMSEAVVSMEDEAVAEGAAQEPEE